MVAGTVAAALVAFVLGFLLARYRGIFSDSSLSRSR